MRDALIGALVRARDGWYRGNGANALTRPQPQPESDCWKWLFAAVRIDSTNRQVS